MEATVGVTLAGVLDVSSPQDMAGEAKRSKSSAIYEDISEEERESNLKTPLQDEPAATSFDVSLLANCLCDAPACLGPLNFGEILDLSEALQAVEDKAGTCAMLLEGADRLEKCLHIFKACASLRRKCVNLRHRADARQQELLNLIERTCFEAGRTLMMCL